MPCRPRARRTAGAGCLPQSRYEAVCCLLAAAALVAGTRASSASDRDPGQQPHQRDDFSAALRGVAEHLEPVRRLRPTRSPPPAAQPRPGPKTAILHAQLDHATIVARDGGGASDGPAASQLPPCPARADRAYHGQDKQRPEKAIQTFIGIAADHEDGNAADPSPTTTPFSGVRRSSSSAGGSGWRMPARRAWARAVISSSTLSRNDATTASLDSGPT